MTDGSEENEMSKRRNQHVVPYGSDWAVRAEGSKRATLVTPTQARATHVATEIAREQRTEVLIHGRSGRIRERNSYGNDPRSRKG